MGVDLKPIVTKRVVRLSDFKGKSLAIDAYNSLYQFLAIIRSSDGRPLRDREGRTTSHLSGLFYRTSNLLKLGIKPVYVFDGKPPILKSVVVKKRTRSRRAARKRFEHALEIGDKEKARLYGQASVQLKDWMLETSIELLRLMGVPTVQAPSEGEAQASFMARRGDVWAAASQDYDSLLFGTPRLVRNVTISGRRKLPRKNVYIQVSPELVDLQDLLRKLGITQTQLVELGILIGTDYNPGGVEGFGPKSALKLIKKYGDGKSALTKIDSSKYKFEFDRVKSLFLQPEVTYDYSLNWASLDVKGIINLLCKEYDFSTERVRKTLADVSSALEEFNKDSTLDGWLS
ncbi:MAG: flap endonuclease-1 [Candidatus Bathyarchaeota archaeon]|nr:MAG: flap endonuclease-1 [Candidatus Bathyarchaeota archaeon]